MRLASAAAAFASQCAAVKGKCVQCDGNTPGGSTTADSSSLSVILRLMCLNRIACQMRRREMRKGGCRFCSTCGSHAIIHHGSSTRCRRYPDHIYRGMQIRPQGLRILLTPCGAIEDLDSIHTSPTLHMQRSVAFDCRFKSPLEVTKDWADNEYLM
jgi:hypothetical protein